MHSAGRWGGVAGGISGQQQGLLVHSAEVNAVLALELLAAQPIQRRPDQLKVHHRAGRAAVAAAAAAVATLMGQVPSPPSIFRGVERLGKLIFSP